MSVEILVWTSCEKSRLENQRWNREKCVERRHRQGDRITWRDREEAVWPEFNNALVCLKWTEFVGQISMGGQRGCKRGRRERQRCAGRADRLLPTHGNEGQWGSGKWNRGQEIVKKMKAGHSPAVHSICQCTLLLQLTLGQRLDLKQINKTISGESLGLRCSSPQSLLKGPKHNSVERSCMSQSL